MVSHLFWIAFALFVNRYNGRGSGNSNIENQTRIYTGTDRGQKQHREAKGQIITRSVQCSLPAYLRDPDNQC
ncbi:hypothetical protein ACFJO1_004551 [Salmonella enterica]